MLPEEVVGKLKIYTDKSLLVFSSEMILLAGLLKDEPKDSPQNLNFKGHSRYTGLKEYLGKNVSYTDSPNDANVIILPYKFRGLNDKNLISFLKVSEQYNIPLLAFYIDDDESKYELPNSLHLWRTSIVKSSKCENEYPMPVFTADYFDSRYLCNENQTIGYCGHTRHGRGNYLSALEQSKINCDFVKRSGFWAPEVQDKLQAKLEFIKNLESNLFSFCMRGAGNFSYRFYETLMMGRIPVLVDTDCSLPLNLAKDPKINMLRLKPNEFFDISNLEERMEFYQKMDPVRLLDIQYKNRDYWFENLSTLGFTKSLIAKYNGN